MSFRTEKRDLTMVYVGAGIALLLSLVAISLFGMASFFSKSL
jgi:hypothetical protein